MKINKQYLLHIFIPLLLITLTITAAWPLQKKLERRMSVFKNEIILYLEGIIDRTISYKSISPSIFNYLEIRNLKINNTRDPESPIIEIKKVKIYYSFFKLFSKNPQEAVTEVRLENSIFNVNIEKDKDLIDLVYKLKSGENKSLGLQNIVVSGKNLAIIVNSSKWQGKINKLFFKLTTSEDFYEFQIRGITEITLNNKFKGLQNVTSTLKINGTLQQKLKWSDLKVKFKKFSSNLFTLKEQTFQINLKNKILSIRKIQDRAPMDLQITYDTSNSDLQLNYASQDFIPSNYIKLEKDIIIYKPWFSSIISGKGNINYNLNNKNINYSADLQLILDNMYLPSKMKITTQFEGNKSTADISLLTAQSKLGTLYFSGDINLNNHLPSGVIKLTDLNLKGNMLNTVLFLKREKQNLYITTEKLSIDKIELADINLTLVSYKNNFDYTLYALLANQLEENSISLQGNLQMSPTPFLQLSLETVNVPVEQIAGLFLKNESIRTVLSPLNLSSEIFISTNFKQYSFASSKIEVTDNTNPDNLISFNISGNNRNIELNNLNLVWNNYTAEGLFSTSFSESGKINFLTLFNVQGIKYSANGLYNPGENLLIKGDYGLNADLLWADKKCIFKIVTENLPVPVSENIFEINLNLTGFYSSIDDWEVVLTDTNISNLPLPVAENNINISAKLSSKKCSIYNVTYKDNISKVLGDGNFTIEMNDGFSSIGWLRLYNPENTESYNLILELNKNIINSTLSFSDSPIKRFGSLPITGYLSGNVNISGSLSDPDILLNLKTNNSEIHSQPITIETYAVLAQDKVNINLLNIEYMTHKIQNSHGTYNLSNGILSFNSKYTGILNEEEVSAQLTLSGNTAEYDTINMAGDILKEDFDIKAVISKIISGKEQKPDWNIAIRKNSGIISFSGGPQNSIAGFFKNSGDFLLSVKTPIPVQFTANGNIKDNIISADIENINIIFQDTDKLIKFPYFRVLEGTAHGKLKINGPLNDPDFNGDFKVTDAVAGSNHLVDITDPFNTFVLFEGKNIYIKDQELKAGEGKVSANLIMTIDHWIPTQYNIEFITLDSKGLHILYSAPGFSVDGYGVGMFRIFGDLNEINFHGNLEAHSALIMIGSGAITMEEEIVSKDFNFYVDLNFVSGKMVEFIWPSKNLPILKTYAETGDKLSVKYESRYDILSVNGDIDIKGGEIYYFKNTFNLREGSISFQENPLDPMLNVRAEMREIKDTGEHVIIYLIVENKQFSKFSPRFESDPPMSDVEIVAFLGKSLFGQLGTDDINLSSALLITSDLVSQFGIIRTFEQKVKNVFKLDLFSVRTQMLSNILREKMYDQALNSIDSNSNSVGRYLDNTTIFLGKYFSNDLFLEGAIQINSNDQLDSEFQSAQNISINSEISLEWNTPLFLLDLSFKPDFTEPDAGLSDTSLGFSWGFTY